MIELPFCVASSQPDDAAAQLEQDIITIVREETGMHLGIATMFSEALVRGLRRRLGGQELYIPAPDRTERDTAIRRDYNGRNMDELMRTHQIGRTRFYEIIGARPDRERRGTVPQAKNPPSPLKSGQPNGYGEAP
ncbi:Mor transcription activator family protein [Variovorax sp. LT1R16]|uniref:Mor transcription activator family protein n=1 Tax=Variovorax sp. LT1R16 TaxID=3443728 RepID=UPI003F481A30